jgi:hypothetical protein
MSRRFGQVPLNLWLTPTFKALSLEAKLAVLFFWCGPHSTSAGIGRLPDAYAAADLAWPQAEWQSARQEAQNAGYIERDAESETVFVHNYLASNRPVNAKHRAAIINQISATDCDALRELAETALVDIEAESAAKATPDAKPSNDLSPQLRSIAGNKNLRGAA